MIIAKTNEDKTEILVYPYTQAQVRKDYPNVSFDFNDPNWLKDYPYIYVNRTHISSNDFQRVREGDPEFKDNEWYQTWIVEDFTESEIVEKVQQKKRETKDKVNFERDKRRYSNITVDFPNGPKTIQYRDQRDETTLAAIGQAAMAFVMSGNPNAEVMFITEDNVKQIVPAYIFIQICMTVLEAKQDIVNAGRDKKDYIDSLPDTIETYNLLEEYDASVGWPS